VFTTVRAEYLSIIQVNLSFSAMPWLKHLNAGLLPRSIEFDPRPVHVKFVVDKVALG
jgi:hypothetical protein